MIEQIAAELAAAYTTKQTVEPPRNQIPELDLAGAYKIQQLQEQQFIAQGDPVIGRKVGLTSLAMQQQLGVDSPDFGFVTASMRFDEGTDISVDKFIAPKVEPELAFRLGKELPDAPTLEDVIEAIDATYLAVEIIDSRVRDWDIRLVDTVADNASCGAIVLSAEPVAIAPQDLPEVTATMYLDGEDVGSGNGAAVMGHPLLPLAWLAETLATQGVRLKAGDVILTGSFCGAAPFTAGQELVVDYAQYGKLRINFQ